MNDTAVTADETVAAPAKPAANPLRTIILVVLMLLLILFVYHVLADRYTPYTSQARVETFMTQVAPEVAGDVLDVDVKDNSAVSKGQLLFQIDPEPYQLAVRAAEANLAVALQGADVSVADVAAARAQIEKQRVDLSASRALNQIVTDLVDKNALARTQEIRSNSDVGKTRADLARAEADLRRAQANLGAPGLRNPKVRQALAALDQAQLDLKNTRAGLLGRHHGHDRDRRKGDQEKQDRKEAAAPSQVREADQQDEADASKEDDWRAVQQGGEQIGAVCAHGLDEDQHHTRLQRRRGREVGKKDAGEKRREEARVPAHRFA
jgi:multidrug efflux pump subunit AcrA (membrane-fusion protein)